VGYRQAPEHRFPVAIEFLLAGPHEPTAAYVGG
jgi:hypothetical protein